GRVTRRRPSQKPQPERTVLRRQAGQSASGTKVYSAASPATVRSAARRSNPAEPRCCILFLTGNGGGWIEERDFSPQAPQRGVGGGIQLPQMGTDGNTCRPPNREFSILYSARRAICSPEAGPAICGSADALQECS